MTFAQQRSTPQAPGSTGTSETPSGRYLPTRLPSVGWKKWNLLVSMTMRTRSPGATGTSELIREANLVVSPSEEASAPVSARSSSMSGVTTGGDGI